MADDLDVALQAPGCERLREWVEIGPAQRAALETFADALAEACKPEVAFVMRGPTMAFSIGNQQFRLAYEPTEPGEFEFMKRMLLHAFGRLMRRPGLEPNPTAWMFTDPENPRLRYLEWDQQTRAYRGQWIRTPLYTARPRYTLAELVKGMQPGDMLADKEWDLAPHVGREEGSAK